MNIDVYGISVIVDYSDGQAAVPLFRRRSLRCRRIYVQESVVLPPEQQVNVPARNIVNSETGRFRLRNDLYCVEWGVKLYSLTEVTIGLLIDIRYVQESTLAARYYQLRIAT